MSVWYELVCDACGATEAGAYTSRKQRKVPIPVLRTYAHSLGWKYFQGMDFCPRCVENKTYLPHAQLEQQRESQA